MTLSQITRFLERHLPLAQFDGEKRDMFQNLLEQAHSHNNANQSASSTSRGRQRGDREDDEDEDEEKEGEPRKSNYKQSPQRPHQRQRSFEESKQQPRSSTRTSSSSPARDIYHFNRHDADVSTSVLLDATSDPTHADRHNAGHEVVAHIAALQRGSFQHKQQHQQEVQRQLQHPHQHQQQLPPRAKSSSSHTSSAPPLPPQLQLQRVHSPEGVTQGGGGDGGHSMYVTNGAIPPPNYVPRAALLTTLAAANKPNAKHSHVQNLVGDHNTNMNNSSSHNASANNASVNNSAYKSNNARYNHSVQDSTSFPTPSPTPSLSTKGGAGKVVVQRSVSFNSSDGSFVSEYSTLKSSKVPPEPAKKSSTSSVRPTLLSLVS